MATITMSEPEACQSITKWAKHHFHDEAEDITPEVEIVSIGYDESDDLWEAELEVSTSADNPHVEFFMDDRPGYGLQIVSVEY